MSGIKKISGSPALILFLNCPSGIVIDDATTNANAQNTPHVQLSFFFLLFVAQVNIYSIKPTARMGREN